MKSLFVASECAPIAKVGGLGDVIGSLPKALSKLGVEVKIIIPFYEQIQRHRWHPKLVFKLDQETAVFKIKLPDSQVEIFLIYHRRYLSTGPIYSGRTAFVESVSEVDRFVFFSQTVAKLLQREDFFKPDIVHGHDWHTGALMAMLRNKKLGTLFTIHNLANQGVWRGKNLMAEGIKNADIVTTVSPTYAKEILTKAYGAGLEKILRKRARERKLIGILNGIDYSYWPKIPHCHSHAYGSPRFGFVARLTYQKGLSLLLPLVPEFVEKYKTDFYFLGQGEQRFEKELQRLAKKYPRQVHVKIGFDEKRARWIYSQSDFFLMPSLFEPSGLGQMIAMRYGTIPIVRATGGLKDSVQPNKTGIVFKSPSVSALRQAIKSAIKLFNNQPAFEAIRRRCLRQNFGWDRSAHAYQQLYRKIL